MPTPPPDCKFCHGDKYVVAEPGSITMPCPFCNNGEEAQKQVKETMESIRENPPIMDDPPPAPERSKCCKAKVRSIVDGTPLGGTGYYQCLACDKPCDLIIPQDTPPSGEKITSEILDATPTGTDEDLTNSNRPSPLADMVGGEEWPITLSPYQEWRLHNGEGKVPEWFIRFCDRIRKEYTPPSRQPGKLYGLPVIVRDDIPDDTLLLVDSSKIHSTPPSKQSEERSKCWHPNVGWAKRGEKFLDVCLDCKEGITPTPPKAEGVGEWRKEFLEAFTRQHPGVEPYFIDPNGDVGPVMFFIETLLTSATRAAEERKDGEWRMEIALVLKMYGEFYSKPEIVKMLNEIHHKLLPPPPDATR